MMLLLSAIVRFVDGGCCQCQCLCRCYWACALTVVVVSVSLYCLLDSIRPIPHCLCGAHCTWHKVWGGYFTMNFHLYGRFYVFDVDSMNRRLGKPEKICGSSVKWKVCTHTSEPSAKNFIDFDFIVAVLCASFQAQHFRCALRFTFLLRHSITAVAHRKLQSCCRMKIFVKCQ